MTEGLRLVIGADATEAEKALDGFVSSTKTGVGIIQKQFERLQKLGPLFSTKSIAEQERFNKLLFNTQSQLNSFKRAADLVHPSLSKLTTTSNSANLSLINLGRVVQDAPFGFLGIANNLNPLLESFQRLKTESGSTGTALKSLGSSLMGAGGLGFAVSLASSALIVFGDKLFGSAAASKASEEALKSLGDQMDRVKGSVKGLADELAFLNQAGAIDFKILGFGDLAELRAQSGAQQAFTRDLRKQMQELKAIGEEITKNEDLNDEDRKKAREDNQKAMEDINDKIKESERKQQIIFRQIALQKVEDQKDADEKAEKARKEALKRLKEQLAREKEALEKAADIRRLFFESQFDRREGRLKGLSDMATDIAQEKTTKTNFAAHFFVPGAFREVNAELKRQISSKPAIVPLVIEPKLRDVQLQQALEDVNRIISQTVNEGFAAIGQGLGEALAGDDIGKAFRSFLNVIGSGVQAIGKRLIELGTIALLAKKGLQSLFKNPAVEIAAGVALVAVGAALKKTLSGGVSGFAEGGLVFGPTMGLVGEGRGTRRSNPEVIAPLDKLQAMLNGVGGGKPQLMYARIRGNDLLLSNERTGKSNRR